MRPRPISAKTQQTEITQDSDLSKHELNASKFSETFSSGTNSIHQHTDRFQEHLNRVNNDPRFRHLVSDLPEIPEKPAAKPSEKPFMRKKTTEKGMGRKVEEKVEKDERLNLSKGFAEKQKSRMQGLSTAVVDKKIEEEREINSKLKSRINLEGNWTINKPGEKRQLKKSIVRKESKAEMKKQAKQNGTAPENRPATDRKGSPVKQEPEQPKQQQQHQKKKNHKTKEELERQNEMRNIERYVSDVEARNMAYFPPQYDRMVSEAVSQASDLDKIDLNNFLEEPTEEGYTRMMRNIEQLDKRLENGPEESIDLEEVIGDDSPDKSRVSEEEDYLNQMSTSELKKRNAFITEILGGKISKKDIDSMSEMDRSGMRMHKLEREKAQENPDDDFEATEINMVKRHSNKFIEKGKVQASGQIYRDCDYLSEQHKQRLEELLNGDIGPSPFECDELETMRRRRIDQGIRMYREMSSAEETAQIFDEETLPKDPQSRSKAEKRILKERIRSVNERLGQVDRVPVTAERIHNLVKQFEFTRHSDSYNELCAQNQEKLEASLRKLQQAERMIQSFQEKENLQDIVDDIEEQYLQLQEEILRFSEIDAERFRELQQQRLRRKLQELEDIRQENLELEQQIERMERSQEELAQGLRGYEEAQQLEIIQLACEGYTSQETLEDIDAVITRKWKADPAVLHQ